MCGAFPTCASRTAVVRIYVLCFKERFSTVMIMYSGSFLIAYFIFWGLGTVPIFIMEVTAGQYLQRGGIEVWNVCPIFKGTVLLNSLMRHGM